MIIVDRFEGDFAVCEENGKMTDIRRDIIDLEVAVGDVIEFDGTIYKKCQKETQNRKNTIKSLMDKIKKGAL